jgi:2-oxoglutarate ferredoxin oxidoreductase subunit alpha
MQKNKMAFIDGSRLITESCVRAGADVFIGYPITPANLLYSYGDKRFPTMLAAPDEITTLQWMTGFATAGYIPVTATSFPGYALMIESINMAYMMELPMVIILVQRLGPATGTATAGAQGDLNVINGTLSGGFTLPTLCISNFDDCWKMPAKAVELAAKLRTPVVLLTSKEMVMTTASFDLSKLEEISKTSIKEFKGKAQYKPYETDESLIPEFLPVSQNDHQVRFTASTHNKMGILQNVAPEALENSKRLQYKLEKHLDSYTYFDYKPQDDSEILIVSFDITAQTSLEAVKILNQKGIKASYLAVKTIFPVSDKIIEIILKYKRTIIAENNLTGQYKKILFGAMGNKSVKGVNSFGKMVNPNDIVEEALKNE